MKRLAAIFASCFAASVFAADTVGVDVSFDDMFDGRIKPGLNYTAVDLTGKITVTPSDSVKSGKVRLQLIPADGGYTNESDAVAWSTLKTEIAFTNAFSGLTAGSAYTVRAAVDSATERDIAEDGAYRVTMAHLNDAIRFDEKGGAWSAGGGVTVATNVDSIAVTRSVTSFATASFAPTNSSVAGISSTSMRMKLKLEKAYDQEDIPEVPEGLAAVMLAEYDDGVHLLMASEGKWLKVPRETFAPVAGTEYEFEFHGINGNDSRGVSAYVLVDGVWRFLGLNAVEFGGNVEVESVEFSGDFVIASIAGRCYDTALAEISFSFDSTAGTNFTALAFSGRIDVKELWTTDRTNGTVRITIKDVDGNTVAKRDYVYHGSESNVCFEVSGLAPGESYSVSAELVNAASGVSPATEDCEFAAATGRAYDGVWFHEDHDTFAGTAPRSGDWTCRTIEPLDAKPVSDSPIGEAVKIDSEITASVTFKATNDTATVVNASVREVFVTLCSRSAGYRVSAPTYATVQSGDLAGITIACDDTGAEEKYRFSVYNRDGSWYVVPDIEAELNRKYTIAVVLAYANPNRSTDASVGYYLVGEDGSRRCLKVFEPKKGLAELSENYRTTLRFTGAGFLGELEGDCYDAHLAVIGEVEYWTIEDAIEEICAEGGVLEPLWYCTASPTLSEGRFGVRDEKGFLELVWPLGYVYEVTAEGDVRYYVFSISDYWTDWADASKVVKNARGWTVNGPGGLAWLARESTNEWLEGTITLGEDITGLSAHIWTPIRGFTGTLEGNRKTIDGLTDKGVENGVTNSSGDTAWALFAAASNSVFRNVFFENVAASNSSDAVAALIGRSFGDLALTNVIVRSGSLVGGGRFVSGIVGCADDFRAVSLKANYNAASVANFAAADGGVNVAGIASLGSNASGAPGSVTVADNENRGTLATAVSAVPDGGNVAQIVAGSDGSAQFDPDAVSITDNVGTGDVSRVVSLNHPGSSIKALPVVNLAAEVSRQDEEEGYKEFIEANDSEAALIDPYRLTARMSAAVSLNGAPNDAGVINDRITAAKEGEVVKIPDNAELWEPIVIDRRITLDLDGKVLDTVFYDDSEDFYTFKVSSDADGALVKNGTVTYREGRFANLEPEKDGLWWTNGLTAVAWSCDYWDRTLYIDGEPLMSLAGFASLLTSDSVISVPEESAFTIDAETSSLNYNGKKALSLTALGYVVREEKDGDETVYYVELDDDPATPPQISLSLAPGGSSRVIVSGARADCEYCLQSVTSLAEDWSKPSDTWVSPASDGDALEFAVDTSAASGFYRISVRKK